MMKKKAIVFSYNSLKTKKVAEKIVEAFGDNELESVNAETISGDVFLQFEKLILGVPTWFDGELPNYWDEFVPELEELDLSGKTFAIFGLGDQKGYPENFGDAIGLLGRLIQNRGGKLTGFTSTEGYFFEASRALDGDRFMGLLIDQENQARLTGSRVSDWVKDLKMNGF